MRVNIKNLIDDVQCFQTVRDLRWPNGVDCPFCKSKQVIKRGFDDTEPARQRYECRKGRKGRRRRLKGKGGRGTLKKERPPVFGMIQRGDQVVINMLANVKQKTIEPFIKNTIAPGARVYTDEYSIYACIEKWGYAHKRVNHGRGEYARDEDGDGFCEVHVNTMEGFWSLLRSWLRPHRGISQEKLPLYLGFFEFVHNVRRRGKALLSTRTEVLNHFLGNVP